MTDSKQPEEPRKVEGRFAYEGLDRILHEKARLGIMTSLSTHSEGLPFNDLKRLCSLTDGNLSRHLQVLREAELVELFKDLGRRRPQTYCRLSPAGRARFLAYLEELARVIADAQPASAAETSEAEGDLPAGWVPIS